MAKSASPIRLQEDLMRVATIAGKRYHRSTAEQIEYWAEIGRQTAAVIDPDVLLSVTTGMAQIKVEPVYAQPVDPDTVFQALEEERDNGLLAQNITSSKVKYQTSTTNPGYLEKIDLDGKRSVGQFQNGVFIAT